MEFLFYLESNGQSGLQTSSDTYDGEGTYSNGVWTATFGAPVPGTYTFYAVAGRNNDNASSAPTSAKLTVTNPPRHRYQRHTAGVGCQRADGKRQARTGRDDRVRRGHQFARAHARQRPLRPAGDRARPGAERNWASTSAAGISGSKFITFGLTVKSGYTESLGTVNLFYRRSSDGPTNGLWQYQLNSGAWVTISDTKNLFSSSSSNGASMAALNLSGIAALQNLAAGTIVNFRLTPYGTTSATSTFYIYNQTGNDLSVASTSTGAAMSTAKMSAAVFSATPITTGDEAFWE